MIKCTKLAQLKNRRENKTKNRDYIWVCARVYAVLYFQDLVLLKAVLALSFFKGLNDTTRARGLESNN